MILWLFAILQKKIVFDLGDILTEDGDECMLDAAKDYMIDLINPDLLDMESNNETI